LSTADDVSPPEFRPRRYVASLMHGLMILDMFSEDRETISIGEMANELGLHKSSASRLASTLAHAGYLMPVGVQGSYRLGARVGALSQLASQPVDFVATVVPHLRRLTEDTGETGHLAVLKGNDTSTLAVVDGWHTIRMHSWVGKVSPAYVSSMGKALLASLDDEELCSRYGVGDFEQMTSHTIACLDDLLQQVRLIRRRGFGFDNEELEVGMRCISAPILDRSGDTVASISISGPSQRITEERVGEIAEHVRWHAACASRDLGARLAVPSGWPRPPATEPPPLSYLRRRQPIPR